MVNEQSKSNLGRFKTSAGSPFTQLMEITMLSRADSQAQLVGLVAN